MNDTTFSRRQLLKGAGAIGLTLAAAPAIANPDYSLPT